MERGRTTGIKHKKKYTDTAKSIAKDIDNQEVTHRFAVLVLAMGECHAFLLSHHHTRLNGLRWSACVSPKELLQS